MNLTAVMEQIDFATLYADQKIIKPIQKHVSKQLDKFDEAMVYARFKSPILSAILPLKTVNCTVHGNYMAHFDEKGNVVYFNPSPNYPEDAYRGYDSEKGTLGDLLTEEEFRAKLPSKAWCDSMESIYGN